MKKLFALSAILAFSNVQAQELKFGDLNYFLQQGQFNVTADVDYETSEINTSGINQEVEGYLLTSKFAYALSDKLNVFIGLNYNFLNEVENKTPVASEWNQDGFRNPVVGANFRALSQMNSAFNLDIGVLGRINIQDRTRKDRGVHFSRSGQAVDPGNTYELNARLGRKWNEANEFYLIATARLNQEGTLDIRVPNQPTTSVKEDSSIDYSIGAFYQYRPVHEFMIAFGAMGTRVGDYDLGTSEVDSHIDTQFLFNAKYLINEDVIAKFNYSQALLPDFDFGANEVTNRHFSSFGLGVDFLF